MSANVSNRLNIKIGGVGKWGLLFLWVLLVITLVVHVFKNKKGSNIDKMIIGVIAFCMISIFQLDVKYHNGEFTRSVYGGLSITGYYLSFFFSVILIVLYFYAIFCGSSCMIKIYLFS